MAKKKAKPDTPQPVGLPLGKPIELTGDMMQDMIGIIAGQATIDSDSGEASFPKEYLNAITGQRIKELTVEFAKRKMEALKLYSSLPIQEAFHQSLARVRLARGSNRAGKTLACAVEVARAVTGTDPYHKYPKEDGIVCAVGEDFGRVGSVMWKALGRPGSFKIIRDADTQRWRAYRPWEPADLARKLEARPAQPLIPARMIADVSWESKAESIPSLVKLTNGWEIHFFSSGGKPPQGMRINLWWFDEEIVDEQWFTELMARILDLGGRGIWSATPQAGTDKLYELHEKAEKDKAEKPPEKRTVEEFVILLDENPHISQEEKDTFSELLTEEERRVRVGGDFAILGYKIYPEFAMAVHGITEPLPGPDWSYYAYVDPGHTVCAVLFVAIPPPDFKELKDTYVLYDELYIAQSNAFKFAELFAQKCEGKLFREFVMDSHIAVHTEIGSGKNILEQFSEELRKRKCKSIGTGHSFRLASDDVDAGIMAVRGLLRIRQDGTPKLRVVRGMLPLFEHEIKRYHRKKVGGVLTDRPDQKRDNHLMDNLRYLAMHAPVWVKPPQDSRVTSQAVLSMRAKARRRSQEQPNYLQLGPGK